MLMAMVTDGIFEAYEATTIRIDFDEIEITITDEIEVEVEVEGS